MRWVAEDAPRRRRVGGRRFGRAAWPASAALASAAALLSSITPVVAQTVISTPVTTTQSIGTGSLTVTGTGSIVNASVGVFGTGNNTVTVETPTIAGGGRIVGTGLRGIFFTGGGGTVVNEVGGTIQGATGILTSSGATTVENSGAITGTTNNPGVNLRAGSEVTNHASGTIQGSTVGVFISDSSGPGTVTNSGMISGGTSRGVQLSGGGTVVNNASGIVQGGTGGIAATSSTLSTSVENHGTVTGSTDDGVWLFGGGEVLNSGTINGQVAAVRITNGSGDTNLIVNSGQIGKLAGGLSPNEFTVVFDQGAEGTLENQSDGTISGANGIRFSGAGTLINDGEITVTGSFGALFESGGSVEIGAPGLINSASEAIRIGGGAGSVINYGTLTGGGLAAIRFVDTFDDTFENHGTVNGNVIMGAGHDTVELGPTSLIGGTVDGETGDDLLRLIGDIGTMGTLDFTDSPVANFTLFEKEGAGAWTVQGDASALTGDWSVNMGTLFANADLSGIDFTLASGTLLGGNGTLGSLLANADSIVSPGNSIGTLSIAGDATFGAGSTFRVEIEPGGGPGTSDFLDISGTVDISAGANVEVLKQIGSYTAGTEWLILTAGTGITGSFDDPVLQSAPMLDLAVEYRPNPVSGDDIWLVLISDSAIGILDAARTSNQLATAVAVDDAGGAVLDAFAGMTEDEARAALDNLSGEIHATAFGVVFDSPWFREGILARLRDAHGDPASLASGVTPGMALGYADEGDEGSAAAQAWRWWALRPDGYLASGHLNDDGNAAAAGIGTGGLMIGGDRTSGDVTLGFAGGFQHDSISVPDRNSTAAIDTWNLGAYAGWTGDDGWRARSGAALAHHGFDTTREIVVPGLESTATATYSSWSGQVFGELGRAFDMGGGTVEPYAGLRLAHASRGAFSETGAGPANLTAEAESRTALISILGVNVATTMALPDGRLLRPYGAVIWEYAFTDMTPSANLMFPGGASTFHMLGPTRGRDTIRLHAGADVTLMPAATAFAAYQGAFTAGSHAHAVRAGATVRF